MRILFTFLLLVLSQQGMAADCSEENISLGTQEDVDGFQATYGTCDTVTGDLTIVPSNEMQIDDLTGVSTIKSIGGNLLVRGTSVTNLDALKTLRNVNGSLTIEFNENLVDVHGLSNVTQIGGHFTMQSNTPIVQLGDAIPWGGVVSLSDDGGTIAIAHKDANGGPHYVAIFRWRNSQWEAVGDTESDEERNSFPLGIALSGDGSTIVATGVGVVRAYRVEGMTLNRLGGDISFEPSEGWISNAISDDGKVIAIGRQGDEGGYGTGEGKVYVYEWSGSSWEQKGETFEGASRLYTGSSVSLNESGSRVAIGSPGSKHFDTGEGRVDIFEWTGTEWARLGNPIQGTTWYEQLGQAIDLDKAGDTLGIAGGIDPGGTDLDIPREERGRVKIYDWNGNQWVLRGAELIRYRTVGFRDDQFSISGDGDSFIVRLGEIAEDSTFDFQHKPPIYDWSGNNWLERDSVDNLACSQCMNGTTLDGVSLNKDASRFAINRLRSGWKGYTDVYSQQGENDTLDCSSLASLLGGLGASSDSVGGDITIRYNGAGCNSKDEAIASASFIAGDKRISPATNCKASNPATSIQLQSRESGLTNTKTDSNISITCPINYGTSTNQKLSFTLKASNSDSSSHILSCELHEYIGEALNSSLGSQATLSGDGTGTINWNNWRPSNNLTNYTITCDLPPQTAITSIVTRVVY